MDWIKKNYDQALLIVFGLILLAFAVLIVLNVSSFNEIFDAKNSSKPRSDKFEQPETDFVRSRITALTKPAEWNPAEGSLFVSKPYVLTENDELVNPLQEGSAPLHPPVPNAWLVRYDLDWADANVLSADPDSDKFSNLEEFVAQTDPTAQASLPPYITKLRLKEFIQVPFRLKFQGSPDNGTTFTINSLDLSTATQFLKLGDTVEGTPYKLVNYEPKTEDKDGLQVDVSELTVVNEETGEKIVLVNDREVNHPTGYADFIYLWDGSEFRVKQNDEFSVEPEKDVNYKLIDISQTEAVIQRTSDGKEFKVPAQTQEVSQ